MEICLNDQSASNGVTLNEDDMRFVATRDLFLFSCFANAKKGKQAKRAN